MMVGKRLDGARQMEIVKPRTQARNILRDTLLVHQTILSCYGVKILGMEAGGRDT
jgi:hypothetical protein